MLNSLDIQKPGGNSNTPNSTKKSTKDFTKELNIHLNENVGVEGETPSQRKHRQKLKQYG